MSPKKLDEPTQSDYTILMTVENLIYRAMGPTDKNIVNYKLLQTVLLILARQLRVLEHKVDVGPLESSLSSSESAISTKSKPEKDGKEKSPRKTKDVDSKGREKKEREKSAKEDKKDEKRAEREREKLEKNAAREKEKAEREEERVARHAAKDKEKADKEKAKAEKDQERDARQATKEKEKADKGKEKADKEKAKAEKEKEKAERSTSKDRAKADKSSTKGKSEKEPLQDEKQVSKDKEKGGKDKEKAVKGKEKDELRDKNKERDGKGEKGQEKDEKSDKTKEKDAKYDKGKYKAGKADSEKSDKSKLDKESITPLKDKSKTGSATSIAVSERKGKGKDKVLVVEKGPTTRSESARVGSIQVVTLSQFELLEKAVQRLEAQTGPLPQLSMPDNEELRAQLASGSASLTDTMQAMQVTARVNAAEEAINRMADLLTQLAAAGALPDDITDKLNIADLQEESDGNVSRIRAARSTARSTHRPSVASRKSVAIEQSAIKEKPSIGRPSIASTAKRASSVGRPSTVSSIASTGMSAQSATGPKVTRKEMEDEIRRLKEELTKTVQNMSSKATTAAEFAAASAKGLADKMDIAMKLDDRLGTLYSTVADYSEQLSGFDTGLVTQMHSFQEQIGLMRTDLTGGLTMLENANNNAETAAVMELTERYEGLANELDTTLLVHQGLTALQNQLEDELRSLVECVEMLREAKADRDEVLDGLRDKADLSRLTGLLRDEDFLTVRKELEWRLEMTYEKFKKQDAVWMSALRDLTNITQEKAELMQLLALKDNTQEELRDIRCKLRLLAEMLGEPKAAVLTRKLARDATCAACRTRALMEPTEYTFGAPAPLPPLAAVAPPQAAAAPEDTCLADVMPHRVEDKGHRCKRWVGGSHTTLLEGVHRTAAPPLQMLGRPTKRYVGHGDDGALYMMEDELQPCVECNQFLSDQEPLQEIVEKIPLPAPSKEAGGGDQPCEGQKSIVIETPQ